MADSRPEGKGEKTDMVREPGKVSLTIPVGVERVVWEERTCREGFHEDAW